MSAQEGVRAPTAAHDWARFGEAIGEWIRGVQACGATDVNVHLSCGYASADPDQAYSIRLAARVEHTDVSAYGFGASWDEALNGAFNRFNKVAAATAEKQAAEAVGP